MHGGHSTRRRLRLYRNGRFVQRRKRSRLDPWWPACAARHFPPPSAKSHYKTLIRHDESFVGLCIRSPHEPCLSTTNRDSDHAGTFHQMVAARKRLSEQSTGTNVPVGIGTTQHSLESRTSRVARAAPSNVSSERVNRKVTSGRNSRRCPRESDKCRDFGVRQRLYAGDRAQFSLFRGDDPSASAGQTDRHPRSRASRTSRGWK